MATRDRVRGMNAAFTTGEAGVGEMTPAKAPLRPLKLIAAVVVAALAVWLGFVTYHAVVAKSASFSGQVTPAHAYYLNFVNGGTLAAMNVRPGQQVKAGQVLATEDSTVDQANLKAAQAEVAADTTELAAYQNPQIGPQQQATNQVDVSKAEQAVNTAQTSLTVAQNTAQNEISAASALVSGRQSVLAADTGRYTELCSGTTSSTPAPDDASSCAALQAQVTKDGTAVSDAQAQLASVQASAKAEQQRDASQLDSSQQNLAAAQSRANTTTADVTPAAIAQVQSDLAAAQDRVATDEQQLRDDSLTAPGAGLVADTAGAAGDVVTASGVHGYSGPAAESGTLSSQQGNGFQMFVPPVTSGGGATQNAAYAPVVTLYTGPMTVTAQLPEENMGGTHVGQGAVLDITAVDQTVHGSVSQILLDPARVPDATYYDVVISLASQPANLLTGMSVQVTLS